MKWLWRSVWVVSALACLALPALAGPNAGGILVAHDAGLLMSATDGSVAFCAQGSTPSSRDEVDARIDNGNTPADPALVKIYAVFQNAPRLMGVTFGLHFDNATVVVASEGSGTCDAEELANEGWPTTTDTGTTVDWASAQTALVIPVYYVMAYTYSSGTLDLIANSTQGGYFGDDTIPAILDPIAGYGKMGFGVDGYVPPLGGLTGACCNRETGACAVTTSIACGDNVWHGPETTCETISCGPGACCGLDLFTCETIDVADCHARGGFFLGLETQCTIDQQRCDIMDLGACCTGTDCIVTTGADCEAGHPFLKAQGCNPQNPVCIVGMGGCCTGFNCVVIERENCQGTFLGENTDCRADICSPAWGACCNGEACLISQEASCTGVWLQDKNCTPQNACLTVGACWTADACIDNVSQAECPGGAWVPAQPCTTEPYGSCCNTTECTLKVQAQCGEGFTWARGTSCDPNPCVTFGACYIADGTCTSTIESECVALDGAWVANATCSEFTPWGMCCTVGVPGNEGECHLSTEADCTATVWTVGVPCTPEHCDTPVERSTWGHIKSIYKDAR